MKYYIIFLLCLIPFISPLQAANKNLHEITEAKANKLSETLIAWAKLNSLNESFCYSSESGWNHAIVSIGFTENGSILLKIISQDLREKQIECTVQSNDPELKEKFQKILSANVWNLPQSKSSNIPEKGPLTLRHDGSETILIKTNKRVASILIRSAPFEKYNESEIENLGTIFWKIIEHYIPTRWDRSFYQTGLSNYEGIPNSASDITIFEDRDMGNKGIFLADFKISESDFVSFASKEGWPLKPIKQSEHLSNANAFHSDQSNIQKEIKDGLYSYFQRDDGAYVIAAYDRPKSRGYIESTLIIKPLFDSQIFPSQKVLKPR